MRKTLVVAFVAFAALAVSGCATYNDPTSGPRARVRFVTDVNAPSILYRFDDPACREKERMANMKDGAMAASPGKRLGMPLWEGWHESAAKEFYMRADQPIYVALLGLNRTGGFATQYGSTTYYDVCSLPIGIQLESGADYEVRFNTKKEPRICTVEVFELRRSGGASVRVPASRELRRPVDRQSCAKALAYGTTP